MSNEKFLLILLVVLALFIGALAHTIWLQGKDLKAIKQSYKDTVSFIDKVLYNIAKCENIDINKYIDITRTQLDNKKKGGEHDE